MVSQRVVRIWVLFLAYLFSLTLTWFVLVPVQSGFLVEMNKIAEMFGLTGMAETTYNFVATIWGYGFIWIGVIFALVLLAAAIYATTQEEGESYPRYRQY